MTADDEGVVVRRLALLQESCWFRFSPASAVERKDGWYSFFSEGSVAT